MNPFDAQEIAERWSNADAEARRKAAIVSARAAVVEAACEYIHASTDDAPEAYIALVRSVDAMEKLERPDA